MLALLSTKAHTSSALSVIGSEGNIFSSDDDDEDDDRMQLQLYRCVLKRAIIRMRV